MTSTTSERRVAAFRRFSRFYTKQVGALQEGLLDSPFPLTEARVIYGLGQQREASASELVDALSLDAGYLSRILRRFAERGLISRQRSKHDGRRWLVRLTPDGEDAFEALDVASRSEAEAVLRDLSPAEQARLIEAMRLIEELLASSKLPTRDQQASSPFTLRPPRPGDMGWVVQRHGALYAEEYGWDREFEALVAAIVADFAQNHNPERERCWIADFDGVPVGSVFLVDGDGDTAKLRLLLVKPEARGKGIGGRLVEACIAFARQADYRRLTLWTNSVLEAAKHLYQKAGFRLVRKEPHHSFGQDLVGETWELDL